MTQNQHSHLKKYSDTEILELIQRSEALKKTTVNHLNVLPSLDDIAPKKNTKFLKYSLPIAFFVALISALYLSNAPKKDLEIAIVNDTPKEMLVLKKKFELLKDTNLQFIKIENTLSELSHLRKEHLFEAKQKILDILEENEVTPSPNINEKLNIAVSNYIKTESEEKELLASSIEDLFKEANCKNSQDLELFNLLIDKENFTPYLKDKIISSLAIGCAVKNFKLKNLHTMWQNLKVHESTS